MKKLLAVLFVLLFIPMSVFAQIREYEPSRNSTPKIITHDKAALWPAQSFYQRKAEWQWIVDSTWGPGVSRTQKLQIFNIYANLIQSNFTLFYRLNLNWDSLRTFWSSKITDATSNGAFHQIMSHLAWSLKDGHSASWNFNITNGPLNPGTPLFLITSWAMWDVSHFGACLTASSDGEIFVFKTIDNHPLGLEPGDVILGYEGVKWMDIVEELMDFHIPIFGASSTNEEARKHDLLISAGINWHMFSTIDIVKYTTGDTLHLSLEPLIQINTEDMIFAEQMNIPGVPKPDYAQFEQGSYGIIDNMNIGYIYIYEHEIYGITGFKTIEQIFLEAVQNLQATEGLVIDLRCDWGGRVNLEAGLGILLNKKITELKYVIRCSGADLYSLCNTTSPWWNENYSPDPHTFYEKPIAILVGPKCMSMGDFTAYRLKSLPNGRFFGRTSSAALGGSNGYYESPGYNGWAFYTQVGETYHPDHPNQYLSGDQFPIDKKIWLTKEDVANGYDTVVEEAVSWINNLSHCYNATIDKSYTQSEIEFAADVKNPNNHSLSIVADILNNDVAVDSIECVIVGNKISEIWSVPENSEDFYSVTIRTKDIEDSTVHNLQNIVRFTTAGPLFVDSLLLVHHPALKRFAFKPYITNLGNSLAISGVTLKINCNDPGIINFGGGATVTFPNIPAGSTVISNTVCSISYDSTYQLDTLNLEFEIMVSGYRYWNDSKQVVVGVEEELNEVPTEFSLHKIIQIHLIVLQLLNIQFQNILKYH